MERFTKTELTQKVSKVLRETFKGPVIITDSRNDSHVLMTIEDYKALTEKEEDPKEIK